MGIEVTGTLSKMISQLEESVNYQLPLGDERVDLNPLIGQPIKLQFIGPIICANCQRKTKKSFSQGYCYPCMKKLARCDMCIMKPETCHYHENTCREPEWGEQNCMIEHVVYLANSSGLKVGITRHSQVPTRWVDQGATQALPIFRVSTRQQSGLVEHAFKNYVNDKTNWRAMLKGDAEPLDMMAERDRLMAEAADEVQQIQEQYGIQAIAAVNDTAVQNIVYPVTEYPTKISSHNFDKNPVVEGTLMGIKGQYLILDSGVINIRKFTSYSVEFSA